MSEACADPADSIGAIPPGNWAVGVSGGADSVALLMLLHDRRSDLQLHVVHLNHETRGAESDGDAAFVRELAVSLALPCTIARISEVPLPQTPANESARFRAARLALFGRVVSEHQLAGVILAHHADDQAETVLHRLLRGAGPASLGGIRADSRVGGLRIRHPLLLARSSELRAELVRRKIAWREDASNDSPKYLRNRLRSLLRGDDRLTAGMLELGRACAAWRGWLDDAAPALGESFNVGALQDLPDPVARHAARRWLRERGAAADDLGPAVVERLVAMARDAATAARQSFPGGLIVRRRKGIITLTSG
jgi:tRNA(Ile)-lysidine synthase